MRAAGWEWRVASRGGPGLGAKKSVGEVIASLLQARVTLSSIVTLRSSQRSPVAVPSPRRHMRTGCCSWVAADGTLVASQANIVNTTEIHQRDGRSTGYLVYIVQVLRLYYKLRKSRRVFAGDLSCREHGGHLAYRLNDDLIRSAGGVEADLNVVPAVQRYGDVTVLVCAIFQVEPLSVFVLHRDQVGLALVRQPKRNHVPGVCPAVRHDRHV